LDIFHEKGAQARVAERTAKEEAQAREIAERTAGEFGSALHKAGSFNQQECRRVDGSIKDEEVDNKVPLAETVDNADRENSKGSKASLA
jgi:hypothetical protein